MAAQPPPDKQKKQLVLVGVLLAVFLLLLAYNLKRSSAMKARRQQAVSAVPVPATPLHVTGNAPPPPPSSETEAVTLAALKEKAKGLKWGRDPFILNLGEQEGLPTLQLKVTGIIYDAEYPEATYAIINEEVVRIGDDIRGIKVIDIQADAVRLKKFNQEFTLYLYQEPKEKN